MKTMKTKEIVIHGTYPYDGGKWECVRSLNLKEVADLLGIEVTPTQIEEAERGNVYLWLNKGFVVINRSDLVGDSSKAAFILAEQLTKSPESKGIKTGDEAVYLHDGHYSLIRRREKAS